MATPPAKPGTHKGGVAGSLADEPSDPEDGKTTVEDPSLSEISLVAEPGTQTGPIGAAGTPSVPSINVQNRSLSPPAPALAPAERYGRYTLLERIGQGGMAEVWRAKTLGTEGFTKDLVIKRILPRFTRDEELVRMFIDEAHLVARLQHANIVQIFDFDREGDTYYLAMELVDGRDLRQIEKAAATTGAWFAVPTAVYLIAEALKGLHYAHTKVDRGQPLLLVHRDISPHNILISRAGDVKIADFGIAKVAARASKTVDGMVKGKLAYMSPEQISGQPLDSRTDIYSMGVVLWELLTKSRLFHGPLEGEVIRRVRDGIVPPPRQLNPDIPEPLAAVVMKMLAADRARRYQTAGEVARDLCALSCYAYEAQALGDLVRSLFPETTHHWTQMLQSMTSSSPEGRDLPSPPVKPPVPPRSDVNMAGSDQKTVMATEVPPEVAARLSGKNPQPQTQAAAPVPQVGAGARTMMAEAPRPAAAAVPAAAAGARTVMASAPVLPPGSAGPGGYGGPPASGGNLPPPVAPGGYAQGLPPPAGPPNPGGGGNPGSQAMPGTGGQGGQGGLLSPQKTMMMTPGPLPGPSAGASSMGHGPSIAPRPMAAPLPLRPANAVFGPGEAVSSPPYLRWVIGPLLAAVLAAVTLFAANRIWPPATGSGGSGPSLFAIKSKVQIVTLPPGATVYQDSRALPDKTPTSVEGDVGKKAQVKIELAGYESYEVVVPFTKDVRPPLNVTLFKKGLAPQGKAFDNSVYEDKAGTKTTRDPDDDDNKADDKAQGGSDGKDTKVAAAESHGDSGDSPQDKPRDDASPADHKGHHRHSRDNKDSPSAPNTQDTPGTRSTPPAQTVAASGKPTITVTVHPWAIVYIDGRKIRQTPLRDYVVSPGKHTLLLVNDTKGKRESVQINATPGSSTPITRSWD